MLDLIKTSFPKASLKILSYNKLADDFYSEEGNTLIDVSGMSKALIFNISRKVAVDNKQLYFIHTESSSYYPTDSEMQAVLSAHDEKDPYNFMDSLSRILGGEIGPYSATNLTSSMADGARKKVLLAFAKPKNERLYHLLDTNEFDRIELITPRSDSSSRSRVARIVAGIVSRKYNNTSVTELDANDLEGILNFIAERFHHYYIELNANVEIALTGSKRQTIAIALLSTRCKFSKVWYVKPSDIDKKRFSTGVSDTNLLTVKLR
jgi:hypothetical protein